MHGAQQHLWMHAYSRQKCIWTHIYTYIYTYTHVHVYMYTCIHRHIYIHTHTHTYMHGYIYIYICIYMCTYTYMYIYMHMHICMCISPQCAPVQQCSSFHGKEAIANLSWVLHEHRAGCCFHPPSCPFVEPAALQLARWPNCSLKKSVQIHASLWRSRRCSVAQASSDHPRWCGPHPVCLWFTLAHGRGSHPRQKSIIAAIIAGLFRSSKS